MLRRFQSGSGSEIRRSADLKNEPCPWVLVYKRPPLTYLHDGTVTAQHLNAKPAVGPENEAQGKLPDWGWGGMGQITWVGRGRADFLSGWGGLGE